MPHSTAWCCNCSPAGHSPIVAQHSRSTRQHTVAKQHKLLRSTAVVCTASASAEVKDSVHVGQTPYGRGLLSREDLPSGERLLSVPFGQLLLLPDTVDPSFAKTQQRFLHDHGELPADLLRFIQGKHSQLACLPSGNNDALAREP